MITENGIFRRICAVLLCLCMVAQCMPLPGFTEDIHEAAEETIAVTTEETVEEATEKPTEEISEEPTEESSEEPVEESTEEPTEEPSEEPAEEPTEESTEAPAGEAVKVITGWSWVDAEEILDPETGDVYLAAAEDFLIPFEEIAAALPAAILATVEGAEESVSLEGWTCAGYPAEGAYTGTYTFVTTLPEGYALGDEAAALEVRVCFDAPELLAEPTTTLQQGSDGYYLIYNEADLREFARFINSCGNNDTLRGSNAKLMADITVTSEWTPIGNTVSYPYVGQFDGQGHTVSGLRKTVSTPEPLGLFGVIGTRATIENVGILNAEFSGPSNNGALVGQVSAGHVQYCYVRGANITSTGSGTAGALVGSLWGGKAPSATAIPTTPPCTLTAQAFPTPATSSAQTRFPVNLTTETPPRSKAARLPIC